MRTTAGADLDTSGTPLRRLLADWGPVVTLNVRVELWDEGRPAQVLRPAGTRKGSDVEQSDCSDLCNTEVESFCVPTAQSKMPQVTA